MINISDENKRIIFILVVIIVLFVCSYFLSYRNISYINNKEILDNKEHYENKSDLINTDRSNNSSKLIDMSSLKNGNDIKNAQYNYSNPIIPMKNPTNIKYVIHTPSDKNKLYMIPVNVEKGNSYKLSFWINGNNLERNGKLNGVVDLSFKDKNKKFMCVNFRYMIDNQTKMVNNQTWKRINILFNVPQNIINPLELYFGYSNQERNITDISLVKVVNNMKGFKITNGLISAYLFNKDNILGSEVKDNVGSKSIVSSSTFKFGTDDSVNILGKQLKTKINPNHFKNQDSTDIDTFTFVLYCNTLSIDDNVSILQIDGNQKTSLDIKLNRALSTEEEDNQDGGSNMAYLTAKYGDDSTRYDSKPSFLIGKNIYFFICSGNSIKCYLNDGNDTPMWSFQAKSKLYFNHNLTINKNSNWNADIHAILLYNRVLDLSDRAQINSYLRYSLPNETKSKMEQYIFNTCLTSSPSNKFSQFTSDIDMTENDLLNINLSNRNNFFDLATSGKITKSKEYNPEDDLEVSIDLEGANTSNSTSGGSSNVPSVDPSPLPSPGSGSDTNPAGLNCLQECINKCSTNTNKNDLYNSLSCIKDCRTTVPSCENYCENNENKPFICNDINLDNIKVTNSCPNVFQQNGNYYVHVPKTSFYGHVYGNTNLTKNYGPSKENARTVYQQNYPKCELPDSLKDQTIVDPNQCPYIIDERNPCTSSNCKNVGWGDDNFDTSSLSQECKNDIINYCKNNHPLDPNCASWKPENKNDPQSQAHRRQFEDLCDNDCLPGTHAIESHPEFNQYIKKDNIPCWNCNL